MSLRQVRVSIIYTLPENASTIFASTFLEEAQALIKNMLILREKRISEKRIQ